MSSAREAFKRTLWTECVLRTGCHRRRIDATADLSAGDLPSCDSSQLSIQFYRSKQTRKPQRDATDTAPLRPPKHARPIGPGAHVRLAGATGKFATNRNCVGLNESRFLMDGWFVLGWRLQQPVGLVILGARARVSICDFSAQCPAGGSH